jgi:3-hydroxyisobutyrate dehydrogenase-like beta-hydroxyacid dehydrogenase
MKVGFIGLGAMGSAMARNLIKSGHELTVYNRTRSRCEALRPAGAKVAETPGEAARGAEALVTMLADDHALEETVLGAGRALESLPEGAVHVGTSTIGVALSRRLAAAHLGARQHYVAAPVFGRPESAAAGALFVVAAGKPEPVERCRTLFDAVGQKTFVVGEEPSAANAVKLAGNFMITAVIESLAEAFALVGKAGVEPKVFLEAMTGSLFSAPVYRTYGALIAEGRFEPAGFKLPLGLKDNRLALALAEEIRVPMPLASLVRDRFLAAMAQGYGDCDWSVIARVTNQGAGLETK